MLSEREGILKMRLGRSFYPPTRSALRYKCFVLANRSGCKSHTTHTQHTHTTHTHTHNTHTHTHTHTHMFKL